MQLILVGCRCAATSFSKLLKVSRPLTKFQKSFYSTKSVKDQPAPFSKSKTYPTSFQLDKTVGIPKRLRKNTPFRNGFIAFGVPFLAISFVFYIFFLSDYNLTIEKKLQHSLPGYTEYMQQASGDYTSRIEALEAKQRLKEQSK